MDGHRRFGTHCRVEAAVEALTRIGQTQPRRVMDALLSRVTVTSDPNAVAVRLLAELGYRDASRILATPLPLLRKASETGLDDDHIWLIGRTCIELTDKTCKALLE